MFISLYNFVQLADGLTRAETCSFKYVFNGNVLRLMSVYLSV